MEELLKIVTETMDKKLCEDIEIIDFRNNSPFLDYFVIGSARNDRMANSIIDEVEKVAIDNNINVKGIEKGTSSCWYLIDLGSIVCHVFFNEDRSKYNLEGLWKDHILTK